MESRSCSTSGRSSVLFVRPSGGPYTSHFPSSGLSARNREGSTPLSHDGDIPTLTFYKTTYTSPYLAFTPVETTTNEPNGNSYVLLQKPTAAQQKLWLAHTGGSIPFVDFAGKAQLTSSQYDPATLEGVSFDDIAADVGNNTTAIGADIDASAKVLIQTICSTLTDNKPADVCSAVGGNG